MDSALNPADAAVPSKRSLLGGRVVWSGLLSLAMPGLGQIHARSSGLGATLLCLAAAAGLALRVITQFRPEPPLVAVYFALIAVYFLFALWAAADAVRRTRQTIRTTRPRWFRSTWFAFLVMLAVSLGADTILPLGWRQFSIPSGSMTPTLLVGDYVVVGTRHGDTLPARGDVVAFKYPRDPSIDYMKRIVGLAGDRVQMKQGRLFINGQICPREALGGYETNDAGYRQTQRLFAETLPSGVQYRILKVTDGSPGSGRPGFDPAKEFDPNNTIEYFVPPDHVFTMGDNRDNSADSRFMNSVGLVPVGNLVGQAQVLYFSVDAEYPWYEIWRWPSEIRWSRLLRRVR